MKKYLIILTIFFVTSCSKTQYTYKDLGNRKAVLSKKALEDYKKRNVQDSTLK